MKRAFLLIVGLMFLSPYIMAQQKHVTGRVVSAGSELPLNGVSVMVKETGNGVSTDEDGNYQLSVGVGQTLVFSYIGLQSKEVVVGEANKIDVQLESGESLEEIVVVGYGTQRRSDLTGSVASIKGNQLSSQAVRNPVQALAGQAAGIEVLQNSGQPGGGINVRVRGGNSLLGGNEPLYVVDGFPITGNLENLNPNDILTMDILKDASATAIYGSRGANGVVLVTTKKGAVGKTNIEYNGYYGVQDVVKRIDMLNAVEFATLANLRAANDGDALFFTESEINSFGTGTNWQEEIFRAAAMQNHSVAIMGGTEKTRINVSGNYLGQEGIVINSKYSQVQLRANIDHNINDTWKIGIDNIVNRNATQLLTSDNTERGSGVLSGALIAPPTILPVNPDGTYGDVRSYSFSPDIAENPVAMALLPRNQTRSNSLISNLYVQAELHPTLTFKTSLGVQYGLTRTDIYFPTTLNRYATGTASIRYGERSSFVNENLLTYSNTFNDIHSLTVLGGVTAQKNMDQGLLAQATGFATNVLENNSLQIGSNPGIPNSSIDEYAILSGLTRVNYGYKGKYLLTASIRADGSSRFGASNKWGYFPSAAVAWRVSEEDFWSGLTDVVNDFKVRASWGETGSTAVSPYQSLNILAAYTTVFDDNLVTGFAPSNNKPNPNLRWESTTQVDGGVDLSLFQSRLMLVFDYYYKKTNDLLTSVPLPLSSGYSSQIQNVGSIENKGFEVSLNANILNGKVRWDMGANLSVNRNNVLELVGGADIFGARLGNPISVPVSIVREGHPVGSFFGYIENGLTSDGNIQYVDLDNNGVINNLDRTIIGDPNPKYTFGINSSLSYQNFDLSFVISAVQGNDIFNYNLSNLADGFAFGINQITDVLGNYWTPENPDPNAKYPRISKNTRYLASDRFIEDGSYIRLRNIQLGYTLRGNQRIHTVLNNSQVYLAAQNLFTITNYSFYTPEVNTRGGDISKGVDQYGYPDARTFMLGLRLRF